MAGSRGKAPGACEGLRRLAMAGSRGKAPGVRQMAWLRGVCEGLRRWALAGRLGKRRGLAGKRLRRLGFGGELGENAGG